MSTSSSNGKKAVTKNPKYNCAFWWIVVVVVAKEELSFYFSLDLQDIELDIRKLEQQIEYVDFLLVNIFFYFFLIVLFLQGLIHQM